MRYAFHSGHHEHRDHNHHTGAYIISVFLALILGLGIFDYVGSITPNCLMYSHHGCVLR
jgi:hypothetical protein